MTGRTTSAGVDGPLGGQSCVVLGGAGGIGAAVVSGYLDAGAQVLAVDRSADRLEALLESHAHEAGAGTLAVMTADATAWIANQAIVARAIEQFGRLNVLTSCIGVFDGATKITDIAGERLEAAAAESFSVNITSLLLAVRAAASQLTANHGRVIATGSFASFEPSGGGALYTAAKHGVLGVVRQLAYELAPLVRVNCVAPGVADTVITGLSTLAQQPQAAVLTGTEAALPLRHVPRPADYAPLYTFLASTSQSAVMTGAVITADSGLSVRGLAPAKPSLLQN